MFGWTISLVVGATLVPVIGGAYGLIREQPSDSRDGIVIVALGGAISTVWLAAGMLTLSAFQ